MKQDKFDQKLMDEVSQLPPIPDFIRSCTPWQSAVRKILWGMGLCTFRFEFLYLQYLLPLLGCVLLYLGCRTLCQENRWFRLTGRLAGLFLVIHLTHLVLCATPVMGTIEQNHPLSFGLGLLFSLIPMGILFCMRQGTQGAFTAPDGTRPKDYLGRALLAYAVCIAIAIWCELVPLTAPSEGPISFGPQITNKSLYTSRSIAFILVYILVLVWVGRQGKALAGRGYDITPAPVRVPGWTLLAAVFLFAAAAVPTASILSARLPMPPPRELSQVQGDQSVRVQLEELGMAPELAELLDDNELEQCREAQMVLPLAPSHLYNQKHLGNWIDGNDVLCPMDDGLSRLTCWAVVLPGRQVRYYQFFQWTEKPALSLQESFTGDLDYYPCDNFSGCLAWTEEGWTLSVPLAVQLGGGQTPEELPAWALEWYDGELAALGHLKYIPYVTFSMPRKGEEVRGFLAWTEDRSGEEPQEKEYFSIIPILRHQNSWLLFPFQPVTSLAATQSLGVNSPFPTSCASFSTAAKVPW